MKLLLKTSAFALLLISLTSMQASAQKSDEATVKKLVDSKNFVFVAQTMIPTGGPSRNITSDYDMSIGNDSLVTYLPYFGRAYVPVLPGEGGINFTSANLPTTPSPARKADGTSASYRRIPETYASSISASAKAATPPSKSPAPIARLFPTTAI